MKNTINTISRIFIIAILSLSSVSSALAHPGHGLFNQQGEGIEHFITSPYHIVFGVLITIVLAVIFIKYRKAITWVFNRNKK